MTNDESSCVVRIVNLNEEFTEETLKFFILNNCQPIGSVKKIYLKKNEKVGTIYSYVVFEKSCDASKVVRLLNEHIYMSNKFEVELIGPNLKYHIYGKNKKAILTENTSGAVSKRSTGLIVNNPLHDRLRLPARKRLLGAHSPSNLDRGINDKRERVALDRSPRISSPKNIPIQRQHRA